MPRPTPAPAENLVITFRADQLEPVLRNILQALDAAHKLAEAGSIDTHKFSAMARVQLHDLLAEVAS